MHHSGARSSENIAAVKVWPKTQIEGRTVTVNDERYKQKKNISCIFDVY